MMNTTFKKICHMLLIVFRKNRLMGSSDSCKLKFFRGTKKGRMLPDIFQLLANHRFVLCSTQMAPDGYVRAKSTAHSCLAAKTRLPLQTTEGKFGFSKSISDFWNGETSCDSCEFFLKTTRFSPRAYTIFREWNAIRKPRPYCT